MRHNRACLARTSFALALVAILFWASAVSGQTTSFSYQGRLSDGGTAANGNYDLQFALFDSLGGATQIGATQTVPNVLVSAGIFTVQLDFGANAFPGANRFLEISARLAGGPSFTTLSPRQQITSTPYAVRSLNASTADAVTAGGTLSGNIVNATTQYNLGGSRVLSSPGNGNFFAGLNAGQANTNGSLNNFFGVNAGQANTTGSENDFFGEAAGYSNTAGFRNSFFGDTAGADTNGTNQFSGSENSFFGGNSGRGNTTGSFNTAVGAGTRFGSGNLNYATAIGANAVVNQSNSLVLGSILDAFTGAPSVNVGIGTTRPQARLHVKGDTIVETGNVGIGTTTPQASLDVNGTALFRGGATVTGTNGDGAVLTARRPTGDPFVIIDATTVAQNSVLAFRKNNFNRWLMYADNSAEGGANAGSNFKLDAYNNAGGIANYLFVNRATGSVGIGTTTPFVNTKLDIVGGLLRLDQLGGGGDEPLCRNSAAHTIATCNASSLRYKESVQPLRQGLHLIQRLRPVTFNWKEGGRPDLGLIAEDVAKVEPLLVTHNDKGEIEGVRYDRLNVVLINAIKQQQDEISRQKNAIDLLTTTNAGLSARLRVVERRLRPKARSARSVVASGARRQQ